MTATRDERTKRSKDLSVASASHEHSVTVAEVNAFADGCAHRDKQVASYLRRRAQRVAEVLDDADAYEVKELLATADAIERGEHVK